MRRILLSCATLTVLVLATAASAGAREQAAPGFLVVRNAQGDGGMHGQPVATVVIVRGFVLGRISQQARVDVYQLPTAGNGGAPSAVGDVSTSRVRGRRFTRTEYEGSGFRFRAIGGAYRILVRGAGIYLFAGGHGTVRLQGSSHYPASDGSYSIDGGRPRSLPTQLLEHTIGRG